MKIRNVRKSELAKFRGLGLSLTQIAERLEITEKEVKTALLAFKLIKSRTPVPEYTINLINDVDEKANELIEKL